MPFITRQIRQWRGSFGKEYTETNTFTLAELDRLYKSIYGITAMELNDIFIGRLNRNIRILEVGSNTGNQLLLLQRMGFKNLYGIDVNSYAVELSKHRTKDINIIYGSVFDIPFKDNYFDLVFTAGLLIHVSPKDIEKAIKEI